MKQWQAFAQLQRSPIPLEEVLRVVRDYWRECEVEGLPLTKRQAVDALKRVHRACEDLVAALDALPLALTQGYYARALGSRRLREAIQDFRADVVLRLGRLRMRRHVLPGAPARARLESRVGALCAQHGVHMTTYDPARYVEPGPRAGSRGGRLAKLLRIVYTIADVRPPADLGPVLRRLCREGAKRRILGQPARRVSPSRLGPPRLVGLKPTHRATVPRSHRT